MSSPWTAVLETVEDELRRTAQRVRGIEVLPALISIRVPGESFSPWAAVLPEIARELGEELLRWSDRQGYSWYRSGGPSLHVELAGVPAPEVEVSFPEEPV